MDRNQFIKVNKAINVIPLIIDLAAMYMNGLFFFFLASAYDLLAFFGVLNVLIIF